MKNFNGFDPRAIEFFETLEKNNNKVWFEKNKDQFDKLILTPLKLLTNDLSPLMHAIDPEIDTTPVINKVLGTIYRDTRYSKNKKPLKSYMHLKFKRRRKDWKQCPSFYFDLSPRGYCYGIGFFRAMPVTMSDFRDFVDANPKTFEKVMKRMDKQSTFELHGDKYKRIIDPDKSAAVQDWYQRKNLFWVANKKLSGNLFSKDLVGELAQGFELLEDLYHFLWKTKIN